MEPWVERQIEFSFFTGAGADEVRKLLRAVQAGQKVGALASHTRNTLAADMHDGIQEVFARGVVVAREPMTVIISDSSACAIFLSPTSLALSTG